MRRRRHLALVLFVAGLHLAVSVGGEALHYIPGMGHFEEMSCGVCVWKGAPRHDPAPWHPLAPDGELGQPERSPGEVLGADECPICHLISQAGDRARAVCWLPALEFLGSSHVLAPPAVAAACVSPYGARAPPG